MSFSIAMPWNEGEEKMHRLLRIPPQDNPTAALLTPQASFMFQRAPLLAIGALDLQNRPWVALWGGEPGFSEPLGGGLIGTRSVVDGKYDPVVQALVGGTEEGETADAKSDSGEGKMVAGLAIDLMTRKRVKVAGCMVAGTLQHVALNSSDNNAGPSQQARIQLVTSIEQSLGNCPKYLNQYEIQPARIAATCVPAGSSSLSDQAKALIATSDMFFLSTSTSFDMDVNHRGGPPGFVRILSPCTIVYPEYSGNRLYQSLGNLQLDPHVGVCFPNYMTGDVLYITGVAEMLVGRKAAAVVLPGSHLAVKIDIQEARYVSCGLGFRGVKREPSPYNPRVRPLASEGNIRAMLVLDEAAHRRQTALLTEKTLLTPSIARFTFSVPQGGGITYTAGQWIALDFGAELDTGYEHMRDEDPGSLNDDFVRTFTISSESPTSSSPMSTFALTIRRLGPVTSFLFQQQCPPLSHLRVPILGIGGGHLNITQHPTTTTTNNNNSPASFIAAGVGITPLLPQLAHLELEPARFTLYWTLRREDVGLARDTFLRWPRLGGCTRLFMTGGGETEERKYLEEEEELGEVVGVERRRLRESDLKLDGIRGDGEAETWWVCVGREMRKEVVGWLEGRGRKVLFEDFEY